MFRFLIIVDLRFVIITAELNWVHHFEVNSIWITKKSINQYLGLCKAVNKHHDLHFQIQDCHEITYFSGAWQIETNFSNFVNFSTSSLPDLSGILNGIL